MTSDLTLGPEASPTELRCPFGDGNRAAEPGAAPRQKRGYFVPGIIALVVCALLALVIDLAGLQSHTPTTLAGRQIDSLVSQSLQAAHPQASPPQVRCPAQEPVRKGVQFSCTLVRAGRPAGTIGIRELSGNGTLHVSGGVGT